MIVTLSFSVMARCASKAGEMLHPESAEVKVHSSGRSVLWRGDGELKAAAAGGGAEDCCSGAARVSGALSPQSDRWCFCPAPPRPATV